jgi:hypothetical protein
VTSTSRLNRQHRCPGMLIPTTNPHGVFRKPNLQLALLSMLQFAHGLESRTTSTTFWHWPSRVSRSSRLNNREDSALHSTSHVDEILLKQLESQGPGMVLRIARFRFAASSDVHSYLTAGSYGLPKSERSDREAGGRGGGRGRKRRRGSGEKPDERDPDIQLAPSLPKLFPCCPVDDPDPLLDDPDNCNSDSPPASSDAGSCASPSIVMNEALPTRGTSRSLEVDYVPVTFRFTPASDEDTLLLVGSFDGTYADCYDEGMEAEEDWTREHGKPRTRKKSQSLQRVLQRVSCIYLWD